MTETKQQRQERLEAGRQRRAAARARREVVAEPGSALPPAAAIARGMGEVIGEGLRIMAKALHLDDRP